MNAITVAITGEAGFAEVHENVRAIEAKRRKHCDELLTSAAKAIHVRPAFVDYLKAVNKNRDEDLHAVQELCRRAANIDNRTAGNLDLVVRACAAVQFSSTLFLAAKPVGLTFAGASTAFGAGMIGFGYADGDLSSMALLQLPHRPRRVRLCLPKPVDV
jgi:hypothetical protein